MVSQKACIDSEVGEKRKSGGGEACPRVTSFGAYEITLLFRGWLVLKIWQLFCL